MIALGGDGPNGTGFQYPFQMQVAFENLNGPPALPLNKFITVYTDSSKKVVGACYSGTGTGRVRAWADVKASRSVLISYTNDTGYDIEVSASIYSGAQYTRCSIGFWVSGVQIGTTFVNNSIGAATCTATVTVPPGATYAADNTMSPPGVAGENSLITFWNELR